MTDYIYTIADDVPGGVFDSPMSDHLQLMILKYIATPLSGINSDGTTLTITFDSALSGSEETILDNNQSNPAGGLVGRSSDKVAVTLNSILIAAGDIGSLISGLFNTYSLVLQYKLHNNNNANGHSETVKILPQSIMPISSLSGTLNGSGAFSVTVGPSIPPYRGNTTVQIEVETFPLFEFIVEFK